ncbi:MAG: endonuclease/exonuclease/phosphatase family protein [Acidobacteriia bacterium]|nr:endonuclease/exonuclease/phosphatase family protein [Terriglobia bacterium]
MNWNVARGSRLNAITEFLAGESADLVLLQETDTNALRTGYRNIAEELRRSQLAELLDHTRRYGSDTPVVLAGDFNLDLTEGSVAPGFEEMHFHNPFKDKCAQTTRSRFRSHGVAIDWILTRGPLDPTSARVHSSVSASDHYPLSLTLKLS